MPRSWRSEEPTEPPCRYRFGTRFPSFAEHQGLGSSGLLFNPKLCHYSDLKFHNGIYEPLRLYLRDYSLFLCVEGNYYPSTQHTSNSSSSHLLLSLRLSQANTWSEEKVYIYLYIQHGYPLPSKEVLPASHQVNTVEQVGRIFLGLD